MSPELSSELSPTELKARILRRFEGSKPRQELADWRLLGIDDERSRRMQRHVIDKLKIDRSFVSRIDTDQNSGAVVSTIVGLSRALGVHAIAEGVETESQATMLRAAGCDVFQGFLFGRPAPLPEEGKLRAAGARAPRFH
mgnify:CR=1 FL=1